MRASVGTFGQIRLRGGSMRPRGGSVTRSLVRVGVIGAVLVTTGSTAAVAGASNSSSRHVVASAFNARAFPGARSIGATAAQTKFRISVVLKMRHQSELKS